MTTPDQPTKQTKTIPLNKWTISATIITALLLIGLGSSAAGGPPETEIRTVTETVEIENTDQLDKLQTKLSKCEEVVVTTWKALKRRNDMFGGIMSEMSEKLFATDFNGITQRIEEDNLKVAVEYATAQECTDLSAVGF